jgi:hypothetical protein
MRRLQSVARIAALVLLLPVVADCREPDDQEAASEPSIESIERWVRELDSDAFAVREAATRNLICAGGEVIGPVTEAATADSLEVSCIRPGGAPDGTRRPESNRP